MRAMMYAMCTTRSKQSSNWISSLNVLRGISANKKKTQFPKQLTSEELTSGCRLGLDSHADMSCVGRHAKIIEVVHGKMCNVQPFNDTYQPMTGIRTVNASFAHDTTDGRTYILNVNNALDFSTTMENSLLCPNQSRINGVIIDDVPSFLDHRKLSTHSITFPQHDIVLPLDMVGPISYLPVRYPSDIDMDECQHLDLTEQGIEWDPDCCSDKFKTVSASSLDTTSNQDFYSLFQFQVNALQHKQLPELPVDKLALRWRIGLREKENTIKSTTQHYVSEREGQLTRRTKTRPHHLRYNQLAGYLGKFASDTFISNVTSTRGNRCIHLFTNRGNYVVSYPMKARRDCHLALDQFLHDVGIPSEILTDNIAELISGEWGKICRSRKIKHFTTEAYSPWQNPAELLGGIVKRKVRSIMQATNTPIRLWDYCWEYVCRITRMTASDIIYLQGRTPFEMIHKYSPDISEYIGFSWYDWVWYHDPMSSEKSELGRWLGPTPGASQGISFWILTINGRVICRSSVSPLLNEDQTS